MNRGSRLLLLFLLSQLPLASTSSQGIEDEEPRRCVTLSRVDRTEIIDDRTIVFHMKNKEIYVNELKRACMGLKPGRPFSYRSSIGQLCSIDMITVLDDSLRLTRGASCSLGMFTPVDEETLALLKGEEEEADVTVVPIEVDE